MSMNQPTPQAFCSAFCICECLPLLVRISPEEEGFLAGCFQATPCKAPFPLTPKMEKEN